MARKEKKQKTVRTSVGGQAVIEGVMMQGKTCYCTAVRDSEGNIQVEKRRIKRSRAGATASKIPFVRGSVNMFSSLVRGTQTLMRSAQVYGEDDEEPGRIEKWFAEKLKLNLMQVVSVVSTVIGIVLAVVLFMWLPNFAIGFLKEAFPSLNGSIWEYVILGGFKLVIFITYLCLILLMKDMQRLYRYHGAEHKTINCYEKGLPLTVENVASCSRLHDRCGTSFLFIVLIINIAIVGVVNWAIGVHRIESRVLQTLAKLGIEIVLLPVIAGVSYEILKLLARFHGKISFVLKSPGLLLQKTLTTREPDGEMIEVAIAAFNAAMEMDSNTDEEESFFVTEGLLSDMLKKTTEEFKKEGIDESDAEWIYSLTLNVPRSELSKERIVKPDERRAIDDLIKKRLTGRPLWYIIGDVDFYDCKIKVDERVLIPRPETEILAEQVVKSVEDGDKILDMCTGSGCIAVSVAKHCKGRRVQITAVDVSDAAIMVARENANYNSADNITFIQSDLFSHVHGRFNIIVCNPPYVPSGEIRSLQKEVKDYEPRIALDGGDDGLEFYRRLASEVSRYITRGGMLMLEVGEGQAQEVLKLFEKRDYAMIVKDFSGTDRFLKIAF